MSENKANKNSGEDIKRLEVTLRSIIGNNDYFAETSEELTPEGIEELKSYFTTKNSNSST